MVKCPRPTADKRSEGERTHPRKSRPPQLLSEVAGRRWHWHHAANPVMLLTPRFLLLHRAISPGDCEMRAEPSLANPPIAGLGVGAQAVIVHTRDQLTQRGNSRRRV
jgi:hypothetical protein